MTVLHEDSLIAAADAAARPAAGARATIFALSSGAGPAGVAVVRLSGPRAGDALRALLPAGRLPAPRVATLAGLRDPEQGIALDRGLVLWFPAPHSFTGEDIAELHLHGGRAVVAGVLSALGRLDGLRPAEPGEFVRRAFDAGKLDLSAVEGLADLVAAETEAQRRQALRQMDGALACLIEGWRDRLVALLARAEAAIDFPEDDLPGGLEAALAEGIAGLRAELTAHLADARAGERLREGVMVAIVGPPNAGKSSLLNALARREAAIVSALPGTTRDVVEVHLDLGGYPVTLADTAGLRELDAAEAADAQAAVEREGMRRTEARMAAADLTLAVFDAAVWAAPGGPPPAERALAERAGLVALNKCDLPGAAAGARAAAAGLPEARLFPLSVLRGDGVAALLAALEARVAAELGPALAAPGLTRARHRAALGDAVEALERAAAAAALELLAEDLRLALRALGRVTGRVDVEEILDALFREFCIGK